MKNFYENYSGYSLDDVNVHYNSEKPSLFNALAYTQGNQIYMGHGQEKYLGHELAHVIQQKQGRVSATEYKNKTAVNTDPFLEREADEMGKYFYGNPENENPVQKKSVENGVVQLVARGDININEPKETVERIENELKYKLNDAGAPWLLEEENFKKIKELLYPYIIGFHDGESFIGEELNMCEYEQINETQIERYLIYVNNILDRICDGAVFLKNSIDFWKNEIANRRVPFIKERGWVRVTKVELTGSDLHDRGLGAAFVTFKFGIISPSEITVMIKPENRDIEQSLLSDDENSLANQFNNADWTITDERGEEPVELNADEGRIGTIKMRADEHYGTIIEKIIGKEINQVQRINMVSTIKSIVFAAMCGLYDLHRENVLWDDNGQLYFIDADNAMKGSVLGKPEMAQSQSGFPRSFKDREELVSILAVDRRIIDAAKRAFEGKHGRIVPLSTKFLGGLKRLLWRYSDVSRRAFLYSTYVDKLLNGGEFDDDSGLPIPEKVEITSEEDMKIYKTFKNDVCIGPGLKREVGEIEEDDFRTDAEVNLAESNFMSGQIPFYEYWYTDGEVKHQGVTICKGNNIEKAFRELL